MAWHITADGLGSFNSSTGQAQNKDGSVVSIKRPSSGSGGGGSGSSAKSVGTSSRPGSSMADQLTSYMDEIYKITDRNNAWSAQQAALQRDWQVRQNQIAMDFNAAEAAKNRNWQEMMSNTAHQREIKDLQAAGLNPVLSAMGGNGAAVTSGATASGVTSAGAKGDTDTSAAGALVSLLGTMWSAQTQLESQRLTAQTNLAIAEKNNSTSQLVAEMYTQQSREASQLAAATQLQTSQISAAVSELVSRINANASYYASSMSHQNAILQTEASKIVAGMNVSSNNRNTLINGIVDLAQSGLNTYATLRGQDVSSNTALGVAQEQHKNSATGSLWKFLESVGGRFSSFRDSQNRGFSSSRGSGSFGSRGGGFGSR